MDLCARVSEELEDGEGVSQTLSLMSDTRRLFIIVDKTRGRVEDVSKVWWGRINTRNDMGLYQRTLPEHHKLWVISLETPVLHFM